MLLCFDNAFRALKLLGGLQEEHLDRNILSDGVLVWLSVSSELQMSCVWYS